MSDQNGSAYISGTMIDGVEIPTADLMASTMTSSTKVSPYDFDDDLQPKVAVWQPKPEVLISMELR